MPVRPVARPALPASAALLLAPAAALAQLVGPGSTLVGDLDGVLWAVDLSDGSATRVGDMGILMRDIAIDQDGSLFGVGEDEALYDIDPQTAAARRIGSVSQRPVSGLDFAPDGRLFLATSSGSTSVLVILDTSSAATTVIGVTGRSSDGDLPSSRRSSEVRAACSSPSTMGCRGWRPSTRRPVPRP